VAIRHNGHYLTRPQSDKKFLLILTDGEPSDTGATDTFRNFATQHPGVFSETPGRVRFHVEQFGVAVKMEEQFLLVFIIALRNQFTQVFGSLCR
ncbi:MAG TPA: hypothetical protein VIS57_06390, partial [Xanthomonadales bacterium]